MLLGVPPLVSTIRIQWAKIAEISRKRSVIRLRLPLKAVITSARKCCLNYPKMHSVTAILLVLKLPSFDTVVHNNLQVLVLQIVDWKC